MQQYEHEVLIYIWRFVGMRVGHAAIKLKSPGLVNEAAGGKNHHYVSWWPRDTPGDDRMLGWRSGRANVSYHEDRRSELKPKTREALASGRFKPNELKNQKYAKPNYLPTPSPNSGPTSDPNGWGQSADAKIRLPGIGSKDIVFGLNLAAMVRWWELFKNSGEDRFNLTKLNCSRVSAMCLLAGGAGRICKPPVRALGLWTPNTILTWAEQIERTLDKRNKAVREIGVQSLPKNDQPMVNLLDIRAWKSATKPTSFSIRRGQVLKIDKFLEEFLKVSGGLDKNNLVSSLDALEAILGQVHSHITEKGDVSKNREVVLQLGQQALKAYRERSVALAKMAREAAQNLQGSSKHQLLQQALDYMADGKKLGLESWGL